jgi:hypothetical protein
MPRCGKARARLALVQKKRRRLRFALNSLMVTGSAGPGDHLGAHLHPQAGTACAKRDGQCEIGAADLRFPEIFELQERPLDDQQDSKIARPR